MSLAECSRRALARVRTLQSAVQTGGQACGQACGLLRAARPYATLSPLPASPALAHPSTIPPPKPAVYGQPLPSTHPHLLAPGELTPGISALEYELRRTKLMAGLPEGSVVVALAGRVKMMSMNIFYKFRQESNFWYLTGWQEPDSALILEKNSSPRGYKMTMFVPRKDPKIELWDGAFTGPDGAVSIFGADDALSMDPTSLVSFLRPLLTAASYIYIDLPNQPTVPRQSSRPRKPKSILDYLSPPSSQPLDLFTKKSDFEAVMALCNGATSSNGEGRTRSLRYEVDRLRVVKSEAEARLMRKAGKISSEGHALTMAFAGPGKTEAQLVSQFEYHCSLQGSERPAYVPVMASGPNALSVHYTKNDCALREGELVLMDAGCELHGYTSDITRSFPVSESGRFTPPQRDLYEAVLRTLKSCIALATESNGLSLNDLHRRSVDMLRSELVDLGFDMNPGVVERLYPHFLGHMLGVDLHDTSTFERSAPLKAGMVITVEPGLYVPYDGAFPKHFQGIGIRVEDDVLVQETDNVVLTASCPKEISDVEAVCQGRLERLEALKADVDGESAGQVSNGDSMGSTTLRADGP